MIPQQVRTAWTGANPHCGGETRWPELLFFPLTPAIALIPVAHKVPETSLHSQPQQRDPFFPGEQQLLSACFHLLLDHSRNPPSAVRQPPLPSWKTNKKKKERAVLSVNVIKISPSSRFKEKLIKIFAQSSRYCTRQGFCGVLVAAG